MRKLMILWSVLFLVAAVSTVNAQRLEQRENQGMQVATFDLKQGKKSLYLPARISGGDVISGAVVDEPSGKSDFQRQKNGSTLQGYVIEVENTDNEQGDGFLKTTIPAAAGSGTAYLILKDKVGWIVDRMPVPAQPAIPKTPVEFTPLPGDISIPNVTQAGQPATIRGLFDGDFATTDIRVNGRPATILVESPDAVIVQMPHDINGPVGIELTENGHLFTGRTHNVDVELTADNLRLNRGQRANIAMTLTDIPEKVQVEVINLTPVIVDMEGGNSQVITIDPAVEGASLTRNFAVTAVQVGGFSVEATILDRTAPTIFLAYPANSVEVEKDRTVFIWRSADLAYNTAYTFRLWDENRLIFTQPGVTGNSFNLPPSAALQLEGAGPFRWDVTLEGNVPFKLIGDGEFRQTVALPKCECESISVEVKVTNLSDDNRSVVMKADQPVSDTPFEMLVQKSDPAFQIKAGHWIKIEVQNIVVKSNCDGKPCESKGVEEKDAGHDASIWVGDGRHFVTDRGVEFGWNNGDFIIPGRIIPVDNNEKTVFKEFSVVAYCSHLDCFDRVVCKKTFSIVLGSLGNI